MLKKRVIPTMLFHERTIVKSQKFSNYRMVGDPTTVARVFNLRNADELIFLDINASKKNKEINFDIIFDIAKECFMPLTVGGGINNIKQVDRLFQIGADKVSLNTSAILQLNLINEISEKYGRQAVVISIDVKYENFRYNVYINGGEEKVDILLSEYLCLINKLEVGEILINSIDRDGTLIGYDLELLKIILSHTNIPIIFSGGCGSLNHIYEAIYAGADAVSAASIFYYVGESSKTIKDFLLKKGIYVRE